MADLRATFETEKKKHVDTSAGYKRQLDEAAASLDSVKRSREDLATAILEKHGDATPNQPEVLAAAGKAGSSSEAELARVKIDQEATKRYGTLLAGWGADDLRSFVESRTSDGPPMNHSTWALGTDEHGEPLQDRNGFERMSRDKTVPKVPPLGPPLIFFNRSSRAWRSRCRAATRRRAVAPLTRSLGGRPPPRAARVTAGRRVLMIHVYYPANIVPSLDRGRPSTVHMNAVAQRRGRTRGT